MKTKYKIGDTVIVSFLGSKHVSKIIEIRGHPQIENRTFYTVVSETGLLIPYVGIDNSERFANIQTDENNSKTINNGNKQRFKRKDKSNSKESS